MVVVLQLALKINHIAFNRRYEGIFFYKPWFMHIFVYWFCYYLHNATVQKIKMPLTPRESENPTIQIEEHSDSCVADRPSVIALKKNID